MGPGLPADVPTGIPLTPGSPEDEPGGEIPQPGASGASEASPSSEGTPDSQIEDVLQAITAGAQTAAGTAEKDPDAFKSYSQGIQALAQAHALLTGQANVKAAGPPKP